MTIPYVCKPRRYSFIVLFTGGVAVTFIFARHMWAFVGPSRVKRGMEYDSRRDCAFMNMGSSFWEKEGVFGFVRKGISFLLLLFVYSCPLGQVYNSWPRLKMICIPRWIEWNCAIPAFNKRHKAWLLLDSFFHCGHSVYSDCNEWGNKYDVALLSLTNGWQFLSIECVRYAYGDLVYTPWGCDLDVRNKFLLRGIEIDAFVLSCM